MKTSGQSCRENADARLPPLSCPAHAEHPVRRGFSAQALLSLEYWIARSRLRQPPSSEGGLRRSRGYAAAPLCWRAEALAKAPSRATTR